MRRLTCPQIQLLRKIAESRDGLLHSNTAAHGFETWFWTEDAERCVPANRTVVSRLIRNGYVQMREPPDHHVGLITPFGHAALKEISESAKDSP